MEWTDLQIIVPAEYAEHAEAAATSIAGGGIYIEDYRDIEQQVMEIAHVDLIEQELLERTRSEVTVHLYLSEEENPTEVIALLRERLAHLNIPFQLLCDSIQQENWENSWKQYYHATDIGNRLAIVPSWEQYETDRIVIQLDPGMAFGTGTHETTEMCLSTLESLIRGGERVLDIGTGSGILAITALKLGAAYAHGIDIDPVCVRIAKENARLNGVADRFDAFTGDLSNQAQGTYQIVCANLIASAICRLAPELPPLLASDGVLITSGIIDTRKDETLQALQAAGLEADCIIAKHGWVALVCRTAKHQEE